jgi:3-oxoacyl-[acyl-carrier-protein] synthase-1
VIPLAIEAIGAVTAVGDNLALSVAAIYTHAQHFEVLDAVGGDGRPIVGAPAPIGAAATAVDRLHLLSLVALRECGARFGAALLPLIVCAPALGDLGGDGASLVQRLIADSGLPIDAGASRVLEVGRDGVMPALALARRLLSSQAWPACLLLAVDSLVVPARIAREVAAGRVAGAHNPTGFVPGEAAAALLLSARDVAVRVPVIAATGSAGGGPALFTAAAVLARAAERALANARRSPGSLGAVCHDGPGDWTQIEELAVADGRSPLAAAPDAQRFLPAISTGDVGAASGVLSLALLAFLLAKGVLTGPALALFVGEGAARGAAVLLPPGSSVSETRRRARDNPLLNDARDPGRAAGQYRAPRPRRQVGKRPRAK